MLGKAALLVFAAFAAPAVAQPKAEAPPAIIQKLVDCRKAPDDPAQLACYRRAAEALVRAEADGDIVVVDREDARKVRRQAFGLPLPSLSLFDRGESEEELGTLTAQVRAARLDATGRWVL